MLSYIIGCETCKVKMTVKNRAYIEAVEKSKSIEDVSDAVDEEIEDLSEIADEEEYEKEQFLKKYKELFTGLSKIITFLHIHGSHKVATLSESEKGAQKLKAFKDSALGSV